MQVLIVRHGIAVERGQPPYENDEERPLTPKGIRRMRQGAARIAKLVPKLDAIYTSPLVRAIETASILVEAYAGRPRPEVVGVLAPASSAVVMSRWLRGLPADAAVALVGHEPNCSELLSYLLCGNTRAGIDFKKGGAALVEVDTTGEKARGVLLWHAGPALLRR